MRKDLLSRAVIAVWYQEELDRINVLLGYLDGPRDEEFREAMAHVVEIHRARAEVLADLMREDLAQ